MHLTSIAGAVLAAATAVTLTSAAPSKTPLNWVDCGDGLQCAALVVPADWTDGAGATTTLELARLPALEPAAGQGPVVVNAGGPSTTIATVRGMPGLVDGLRRHNDVVLLDPRGLGEKGHVSCLSGPRVPGSDSTDAEWERFTTDNAAWDAACRAGGGPVADHVTSWQVAHDLDAVREALGEPKLRYFANSYGTVYGQAYAELFPQRVDRMVLDSVVDHVTPGVDGVAEAEAEVAEELFAGFVGWCATAPECALRDTDAAAEWDALLARAEQAPLPAPGATPVTALRLREATREMVTARPAWPALATALDAARKGDASGLAAPPPRPPRERAVYVQSFCSDLAFDRSAAGIGRVEDRLRAVAPRIGWTGFRATYGECAGLALPDTFPPHPIAPVGLPPVLVVGGTLDPATPVAGTRNVAAQLPGSRLLTSVDGHALYLHGNACVRGHVERYLTDGTLPVDETVCPA